MSIPSDSISKFITVAKELDLKGLKDLGMNDFESPYNSQGKNVRKNETVFPLPKHHSPPRKKKRRSVADALPEVSLKAIMAESDKGDNGGDSALEVDNLVGLLDHQLYDTSFGDSGEISSDSKDLLDDSRPESDGRDHLDDSRPDSDNKDPLDDLRPDIYRKDFLDNSRLEVARFAKTRRGQPLLIDLDGYSYIINRKTILGRFYWVCQNKKFKCKGNVISDCYRIIKNSVKHNHQPLDENKKAL